MYKQSAKNLNRSKVIQKSQHVIPKKLRRNIHGAPKNAYTFQIIVNEVFFHSFNFQNVIQFTDFILFLCHRLFLKLTSILVQILLTALSNGATHITKQSPWYLCAFTFNGCSQFSNNCRFHSVDSVF